MSGAAENGALPDAVAIAYVHQNECTMSWHHSIVNLLNFDVANAGRVIRGGFIAMNAGTNGLVESRNMAVQIFLEENKAPWLFWSDTDMGFLPDTVEKLVQCADPIERPIVGALCFSIRQTGTDDMGGHRTKLTPTIFDWAQEGDAKGFAVRFNYTKNVVTRCSGTGSACIVIHRSVFEKIKANQGPVWYDRITNPTTGQLVGEDLSFCWRAAKEKIPVFVHTGVQASHAKTRWLIEEDYNEQLMAEAVEQTVAEKAVAPVAVIVPVLGRPQNAAPFMDSLKASTDKATVYAIVGPDKDAGKSAVAWQKAGAQVRVAQGSTFAEKVNAAYKITTEPWLLLVGDDVRFHPGWLEAAQSVGAKGASVVGTNDLGNPRVLAGEHTCHPLIRRSYIDEMGASWDGPGIVCHEGYGHWYVDHEIVLVAMQRGVWAMALDSVIEHMHPLWHKGEEDETYKLGWSKAETDKATFKLRLLEHMPGVKDQMAELVEAK